MAQSSVSEEEQPYRAPSAARMMFMFIGSAPSLFKTGESMDASSWVNAKGGVRWSRAAHTAFNLL